MIYRPKEQSHKSVSWHYISLNSLPCILGVLHLTFENQGPESCHQPRPEWQKEAALSAPGPLLCWSRDMETCRWCADGTERSPADVRAGHRWQAAPNQTINYTNHGLQFVHFSQFIFAQMGMEVLGHWWWLSWYLVMVFGICQCARRGSKKIPGLFTYIIRRGDYSFCTWVNQLRQHLVFFDTN